MAGSVNEVTLIGHLGADPEIKSFANGGRIANFRLATSESWNDKQSGERRERTEWHSVSVSGDGLVGIVDRFLKKGSRVFVRGALRTRKWQEQSGADRWTTEVVLSGFGGKLVLIDGAPDGGRRGGAGAASGASGGGGDAGGWNQGGADFDDDVPF